MAFNSLGYDLELVLKRCFAEKYAKNADLKTEIAELKAKIALLENK